MKRIALILVPIVLLSAAWAEAVAAPTQRSRKTRTSKKQAPTTAPTKKWNSNSNTDETDDAPKKKWNKGGSGNSSTPTKNWKKTGTDAEEFAKAARARAGSGPMCVCTTSDEYSVGRVQIHNADAKTGLVHASCTVPKFTPAGEETPVADRVSQTCKRYMLL